jgi:hypothetical protein
LTEKKIREEKAAKKGQTPKADSGAKISGAWVSGSSESDTEGDSEDPEKKKARRVQEEEARGKEVPKSFWDFLEKLYSRVQHNDTLRRMLNKNGYRMFFFSPRSPYFFFYPDYTQPSEKIEFLGRATFLIFLIFLPALNSFPQIIPPNPQN